MRTGLVLLASLLLVPPAHAQWTEPQTVTTGLTCNCLQQVAMDSRGGGVVAWQTGAYGVASSVVKTRDVRADASLSSTVRVSPRGQRADAPRVAVARDGQAAILFGTGPHGNSTPGQRKMRAVQLVTRAPGGRWSKPRTLSRGGRNSPQSVVIEPSGRVVAAWNHYRRKRESRVEVRRMSAGGRRTISFTRLPYGTLAPRLATSPAFPTAALVYSVQPEPGTRALRLRVGHRDRLLDDDTTYAPAAFAAGNRLTVAWGHDTHDLSDPKRYEMRAAALAPGTSAPIFTVVDAGVRLLNGPSLGAEGDRSVLSYTQYPFPGAPESDFVPRIAQAQDGAFAEPADLDAFADRVATRIGGGRVVAAWTGRPTTTPTAMTRPLLAAVGDAGSPLGPAVTVTADEDPDLLKLAMSSDGSALIVYRTSSRAGNDTRYTLRMARLPG